MDQNAVDAHLSSGTGPLLVMASTVAGKGVSFMEGQVKWHYTPMSDEEFVDASAQVRLALNQLQVTDLK